MALDDQITPLLKSGGTMAGDLVLASGKILDLSLGGKVQVSTGCYIAKLANGNIGLYQGSTLVAEIASGELRPGIDASVALGNGVNRWLGTLRDLTLTNSLSMPGCSLDVSSGGTVKGSNMSLTTTKASDTLRRSNDNSKTTASPYPTFVKVKETAINDYLGIVRLKFTLGAVGGGNVAVATIYKNGVAIGIERQTASTSETFSEDLGPFIPGDKIQIYACNNQSLTTTVSNLRIYYDVEANVVSTTNQDP